MLHLPRVMFAAPASGSGKTMITCGILEALSQRGLRPSSFKCGPDYIDPMFHTKVIGTPSRNLDTFFTDAERTRFLFAKTAKHAGISVLEGVMGLYDGLGGISAKASSYDLASVTETPVILIVNAAGMSLSVIPLIQGYLEYQRCLGGEVIRGVILNRMTKMTYLLLKEEIEKQTGVRLFGYVPKLEDAAVESRHLGLVTPDEIGDLRARLSRLGEQLEQCLDLEEIIKLANMAPDYPEKTADISGYKLPGTGSTFGPAVRGTAYKTPVRIAVAQDEAFCFYYQDNLELLELLGAELIPFSPLHDPALPQKLGGLLIGGGYPELYAQQLSENMAMKAQIHAAIADGIPYLAECGGFMYLHETMEDMEGRSWPMCGCIKGHSYRTQKLGRFGYITLAVHKGCADGGAEGAAVRGHSGTQLLSAGETIRAHEFHYFDSTDPGGDYTARKPTGKRVWSCIHGTDHSAAGYPHLYFWSNPAFAARFAECARNYAGRAL